MPQQKFIAHLFSLWFCVRGRFNFTNLSRYSYFHERTFRRGFAQDFNWLDFNRRLLTIMIPPCNLLIAAMDASFITKSGKHTPQLGWFFNGCASRVEKGLEASTIAILDVTLNTAYGLSARQTLATRTPKNLPGKKKQKTSKEADGESRLDFYLRHLCEVRPYFPALVRHLAVDGYYARRTFVDGVLALDLDVIGKLRHDASLCHLYTGSQKARGRRRVRGERVNWKNLDLSLWHNEGEMEKGTCLYSAVVFHNSLKRQIKVALLVRKTAKGVSRVALEHRPETQWRGDCDLLSRAFSNRVPVSRRQRKHGFKSQPVSQLQGDRLPLERFFVRAQSCEMAGRKVFAETTLFRRFLQAEKQQSANAGGIFRRFGTGLEPH